MSNNNSILPFSAASMRDQQEALGITRMEGEDSWNQTIGGLIFQGGKINAIGVDLWVRINFQVPFPKKVLGIFTQPIYNTVNVAPSAANAGLIYLVDLQGFTFDSFDTTMANCYWWAIGF